MLTGRYPIPQAVRQVYGGFDVLPGRCGQQAPGTLPAVDDALAARLLRWVQALRASAIAPQAEPDDPLEPGALRSALSALARHAREPQAGGWRVGSCRWASRSRSPSGSICARCIPTPTRPAVGARPALVQSAGDLRGRAQSARPLPAGRALPGGAIRSGSAHRGAARAALQDDIRVLVQAASEVAGVTGKLDFRAVGLLDLTASRAAMGRQVTS